MCFFRKTNKKIQDLGERVDELTKLIKSREYEKYKKDSEELLKLNSLLKNIKINILRTRIVKDEENDGYVLRVKYDIPDVLIKFDENGEPEKNEMFYAINYLDLISMEDLNKVIKDIETIKKQRK